MPPSSDLFDLHRRYAMAGDVTDVVHVPLETAEAVQHIFSIHYTGIYSQRPAPAVCQPTLQVGETTLSFRMLAGLWFGFNAGSALAARFSG